MTEGTVAAIYTRISLDPEGLRAGVERQAEDCQRLCDQMGWSWEVFSDNSVSAYSGKVRPAYERMLEAVSEGKVQAIVAWAPDRLHRQLKELESFIDLVDRTKCQVLTVQAGEWDLTTPEGRFMARQLGLLARLESEKTAARTSRARLQEAQQGKPHKASNRPYGFEEDRVTHNPVEAAAIQDIAQRVLRGESLRSASLRHGKNPKDIRRVLLSARVAGFREHKGIRYKAQWEPILDEHTVEAVTALLKTKNRDSVKANNQYAFARKYLLSGFLECGECGSKMYGIVQRRPNKTGKGRKGEWNPGDPVPEFWEYYKYTCHPKGCVIKAMPQLEEYVLAELLTKYDTPKEVPIEIPAELTSAPVNLRTRLDEAKEMWKTGVMSATEYAEEKLDLESRLAAAEDALTTAILEAEDRSQVPLWETDSKRFAPAIEMLNRTNQNFAWWSKADLRQKRIFISKHIIKVVVFKTEKGAEYSQAVKIDWKDHPNT